jgi:hypothetical protein
MFGLKIGGIAAGAAFIISFLLCLISSVSPPALVIRPFIFAVLFFALAYGINFVISHFLPELLDGSAGSGADFSIPGSRIDISEGESLGMGESGTVSANLPGRIVIPNNYVVPEDSDEGLGDISDIVKTGIGDPELPEKTTGMPAETPAFQETPSGLDQGTQNGYTEKGSLDVFSASGGEPGVSPPAEGAGDDAAALGAEPVEFLPDLDSLAGAFMSSSGENGDDTIEYSTAEPGAKPSASSKGQSLEGDFSPQDLASGIRTILNKEE